MRRSTLITILVCSAGATTLAAQPPSPRMGAQGGPGGAVGATAEFLLAHTGELRLTDAQVTRLAAIARRAADRRRTLRARMDSLGAECRPPAQCDSAARARVRERALAMRPEMERLREQTQADRRDAITVLTPEQQALAWERVASRRGAGFGPGRGPGAGRRGAMPRRGPGMGGMDGPRLRERRDDARPGPGRRVPRGGMRGGGS